MACSGAVPTVRVASGESDTAQALGVNNRLDVQSSAPITRHNEDLVHSSGELDELTGTSGRAGDKDGEVDRDCLVDRRCASRGVAPGGGGSGR